MYRICDRLLNRKKNMFFGPLIENIMSKLKNSKWRIQNVGLKKKKQKMKKKKKKKLVAPHVHVVRSGLC